MKVDKKTILAIVLGIAAVAVVLYQVMGAFPSTTSTVSNAVAAPTPSPIVPTSQTAAASVQVASAPTSAADYANFIATVTEDNLPFKSKAFRNPMTPLVSEQKADEPKVSGPAAKVALGPSDALSMGYSIEGIVWNDVEPLAIINNQVVGVGEMLDDGSVITEISSDIVKFSNQGKNYFLVFREE